MAKFYVESGSVQAVVNCVDVEGAALWAVNLVMDEMNSLDLFGEDDVLLNNENAECHFLDETILVSEQGFGRSNAVAVETKSAIQEWFELYQAISMMDSEIFAECEAGVC